MFLGDVRPNRNGQTGFHALNYNIGLDGLQMEFLVGSNSTKEKLVVLHILEGSNKDEVDPSPLPGGRLSCQQQYESHNLAGSYSAT